MEQLRATENRGLSKDTIPAAIKQYFFKDISPPSLMKDYDVIGFDADHCLVKYKLKELLVLLIKGELETLVKLGYPPEMLEFNYEEDLAFCLNASVYDIENGIVLKLVEGCEVARAMRGHKVLNQQEICSIYGSPPVFKHMKWPQLHNLSAEKGGYWCFVTFFESPKAALAMQAIHLLDKGLLPGKSVFQICQDIKTVVAKTYIHFNEREVFSIKSFGNYFPAVIKEPTRYIYEQFDLRETLQKLRDNGKKLFIASNSHAEYLEFIMQVTLGEDWRSFFDLVCAHARKPVFFADRHHPFYEHDASKINHKGKTILKHEELKIGSTYLEGNSTTLHQFFEQQLGKNRIKVAYFGDQYMTDVYASHSNPNWHGIAVVEELLWYDETFGQGIDHGLTKYDKYWGPHYFYESSADGQSVKRNLILAHLAENSRYWVPLIKNINMLF